LAIKYAASSLVYMYILFSIFSISAYFC
jgi:hypothetical protein